MALDRALLERMEQLLRDSTSHAVALCRILLPDYVCLGFPLPEACQRAIGHGHGGVTCALQGLPKRLP